MEVAPRSTRQGEARRAFEHKLNDEALRARYVDGVQGPLEKSDSAFEKRVIYGNMRWPHVAGTVLEKFVTMNLPVAEEKNNG